MNVVFQDRDVSLAVHAGVNISLVIDQIRPPHVRHYRDFLLANPTAPYVTIIGPRAIPPRDSMRRQLMEPFGHIECPLAVLAFLQSGFRGAVSRSVATAMSRLLRLGFPVLTASSTDDAARLVETRCGRRDGLAEAMHKLFSDAAGSSLLP